MKKTFLIPSMAFLSLLSINVHARELIDDGGKRKGNSTSVVPAQSNSIVDDGIKQPITKDSDQPKLGLSTIQNSPRKWYEGRGLLRELPQTIQQKDNVNDDSVPFKPSVQVGAIVHMFAGTTQSGFGPPPGGSGTDWNKTFTLYRCRVLVGGQLSKKGSFFMETDLPSPVGIRSNATDKNVKVSQIILDAQYEHKFAEEFQVIAGLQLVSHNRNGLQGAAALMANDFTFFQYPYNLFSNSPLQGNFGRDLGVNFRGLVLKQKLEYRLGVFTGRRFTDNAPLRTVGRLVYNFLDADKSFYYAGTNIGNGKTISLGAGFDAQATYSNVGADLFIDVPVGPGSVTLNTAFTYMSGGTNISTPYSFARMIPKQTVQFLELGYYFKSVKLQPWIRYEHQGISAATEQVGPGATATAVDNFNKANSSTVFGGGLNYFFNGYGTNLRLSYTSFTKNIASTTTPNQFDSKSFGQLWLQLQFFLF